jgi:hypothetical protein
MLFAISSKSNVTNTISGTIADSLLLEAIYDLQWKTKSIFAAVS